MVDIRKSLLDFWRDCHLLAHDKSTNRITKQEGRRRFQSESTWYMLTFFFFFFFL